MAVPHATLTEVDLWQIERLARRPRGVCGPEIMEVFEVSKWAARRALKRLEEQGVIKRSGQRRRVEVFGPRPRGKPAVVYRVA